MSEMTTAQAAEMLGVTQQRVTGALRAGHLKGRRLADGTWLVHADSIVEFGNVRATTGRSWSPATSWAVLFELSGLPTSGIAPRTAARISSRIRVYSAEEIARKVASRTVAHRYAADSLASVAADLVLTGRSATEVIGSDLAPQNRVVEGYVREGTLDSFVRRHLLVAADDGDVKIYERADNLDIGHLHAPVAVVAADLARSVSTRERSAGLTALEGMRQQWLDKSTM